MSEMSKDDKRLFLRFISGSPRLPLGGFAGLSPRLTIVKAVATLGAFSAAPAAARAVLVVPARFVVNKLDAYCLSPGAHQDELLPTCSTCQVYLKLPAYSSIDILRDKLLTAIREGQEYFALD